jgi:hypothetical protein
MIRALAHLGLAFVAAFIALAPERADAKRVALVIGNDAYENLTPLKKAVADAMDTAAALKEKGFDNVLLKTNLNRDDMDLAIGEFVDMIEEGDTAVFFYSGHGWSDGGENFLVATDAPNSGKETQLARISTSLKNGTNGILDEIASRGAGLKVAIIDACRDNPFTSTVAGRSIGNTRGLARVDPPSGTFVIFSAGAGQTALDRLSDDDADRNSVFTRTFLPYLRDGVQLLDAVKEVQTKVYNIALTASHQQQPAYYDEVRGDACLFDACRSIGAEKLAVTRDPCEGAKAHYDEAKEINTAAALQNHLSRYGACEFAGFAEERMAFLLQTPSLPGKRLLPKPGTIEAQCEDLAASRAADEIDTAAAIDVCSRALAEKPGDYRLTFLIGRANEAAENFDEARKHYSTSAEQGFADAQYALGNIFASGRGVPEDDAEALKWIRLSAEQGYARGQYMLANFYFAGQGGVLENKKEAIEWFKLAARQGRNDAQYNLGQIYFMGDGVQRDLAEAARWFQMAAEQGNAKARSNLGYMYYAGQGVLKDDKEALRLFNLAAKQDDANANWLLGSMHYSGRGVPKDPDQAAHYFLRALALKSGDAYRELIEKRGAGLSAEVRRAMQNELRTEGVYSGSIDGSFGAGTQSALEAYAQKG